MDWQQHTTAAGGLTYYAPFCDAGGTTSIKYVDKWQEDTVSNIRWLIIESRANLQTIDHVLFLILKHENVKVWNWTIFNGKE